MSFSADLQNLIVSLQTLTGAGICFHDYEHLFDSGDIDPSYVHHHCDFCEYIRSLDGKYSCVLSDRTEVGELALRLRKPFFHKCAAGLTEYVIPLIIESSVVGVVFLGQCITEEMQEGEILKHLNLDDKKIETIRNLYHRMPVLSKQQLIAAGNIFSLAFLRLVDNYGKNAIHYGKYDNISGLIKRIKYFISANYMTKLSLSSLAETFFVSPAYLSRIFRENMNKSVMEYIFEIRIAEAKNLLSGTKMPIGSVAFTVGYEDQNYFSRLFRKQTGLSPCEYRAASKKQAYDKTAFG